jgi:endonuclease/exonuclease/phosphatase family protein
VPFPSPPHARLLALALALAALLTVAASPALAARAPSVTVMTRNLFLGANLPPLAVAPPGAPFEQAAGAVFAAVQATDPEGRMKLVAREIAKDRPDLVGLQELSLWRTGPKGDPAGATTVVYDYLATIRRELARLHAGYRVVTVSRPLNLEGPTDRDFDVRLTLGDAILARRGVTTSRARSGIFRAQLQFPTAALGTVPVLRGWNSLDARVRGARLRFVNAHLEAYSPDVRLAQARELVRGPLRSRLTTILAGDLNSGPRLPKPEDRPPFQAIARAGFVVERTPKPSCCYHDDLRSGVWDHNVDYIMARPRLRLVRSSLTGREQTATGVWPADHGGVVSVLRLRR